MREKTIDILSIGEILIDFIGHQTESDIFSTTDYKRFLGGSPTNVAVNTTRLGLQVKLISSVGNDGLGKFVLEELDKRSLERQSIAVLKDYPTSIILVSKTTQTPDFLAYREADKEIYETQIPDEWLSQARIFHTTCFALSKNPARQTILAKAKKADSLGCRLSIDLNYAPKIWPNREEAHQVVRAFCAYNPLLKLSEDDIYRYFGREINHAEAFEYFHQVGVEWICLTLGSKGVKLSRKGFPIIQEQALHVEKIVDATGAGDAFWSGFLFAFLQEKSPETCIRKALKLASIKLQSIGGLPKDIDILAELQKIS